MVYTAVSDSFDSMTFKLGIASPDWTTQ